jgi:hypothetical protein
LRQLFHHALHEHNLINDGDFDWIKRLQEHRINRNKIANTTSTGITSTQLPTTSSKDVTTKTMVNTLTGASTLTPNGRNPNHVSGTRHRSTTQRSTCHYQLPLSSTNATTITLNGGSKTTLSMASTSKIPTAVTSSRTTIENPRAGGPPPTKRRGLVPAPVLSTLPSAYSYHDTYQQVTCTNVNNSNNTHLYKEPPSSLIGQASEPTCCFFKRKAKRALQITSTTSRKI